MSKKLYVNGIRFHTIPPEINAFNPKETRRVTGVNLERIAMHLVSFFDVSGYYCKCRTQDLEINPKRKVNWEEEEKRIENLVVEDYKASLVRAKNALNRDEFIILCEELRARKYGLVRRGLLLSAKESRKVGAILE